MCSGLPLTSFAVEVQRIGIEQVHNQQPTAHPTNCPEDPHPPEEQADDNNAARRA
jgi:hypothetical protein